MKRNPDSIAKRVLFYILSFSGVLAVIIAVTTYLLLISDIVRLDFDESHIWLFILVVFSISLIGGCSFGTIVTFIALKPLHALTHSVEEIANGNYNVQVPRVRFRSNSSEVRKLIDNFNKMVQKLQQTETLSADFVSNISHEFKTPLLTIQGYAKLLEDESLDKEERKKYVRIINDSISNLSTLVTNILKISKLENSEITVDNKRFKLDEQIRQAIIMLEASWSDKNIDIDFKCDNVAYFIKSDDNLLMQVWINLIGNAIKYSHKDQVINISLKNKGPYYEVIIEDSGIGMSEDTLEHIYEKFYQGDKSHHKEGNGLGMPLVKDILSLLDCEIDIKSMINVGTTITVNLPLFIRKDN